ncbi:hypothetical protein JCGZ_02663 [Jatropha curcas]|uniref:Sodium/calcium exchanger membrane region domain-containing protein n=1 Tax=Jatropha curcas TaxID=180498 RepID=A0A067KXE0_JATCU|nr:hypothetical protein JCGZ_02663 [Jatropha curcas]
MASFTSKPRKLTLFLNTSFLFLSIFYISISYFLEKSNEAENIVNNHNHSLSFQELIKNGGCTGLHDHADSKSKCVYIKSHIGCKPKGYINYLEIFYCTFGQFQILGYAFLLLWLAVLFYLLGNTAAEYFCSSLEDLSKILKLSPTIAGVTLLSLGNGAPDVFASIVSFTKSSNGEVGLNSVLGGAFFVSSTVVGVIKPKVNPLPTPPSTKDFTINSQEDVVEMGIPLLGYVDDEKPILVEKKTNIENEKQESSSSFYYYLGRFLNILELPLYLPRRLTIPVVSEERWSKAYAVISVTLAPFLLAAVSETQMEKKMRSRSTLVAYSIAGFIGMFLGNLAFVSTKSSNPPNKFLFPWLACGFLMSVAWTYIIAEELVSLLVSIGLVFWINPSVLGLTVLAWGNSLGDLIANVAMAMHGGSDGAQIAISGCYAGPMFNTLLGLGLSFVISSWAKYPNSYTIPNDPSLYETLGFLMAGLLWALVILPRNNMRLDKSLGVGLLTVYLCFISLRLARAFGLLKYLE